MEELLEKQNKHLEQIANLMKTDRLMQLAQTYGIRNIDTEDDKSSKELEHIADSIDSFKKEQHEDESKTNTKDKDNSKTIVDSIEKSSKESKKYSDKHAKEQLDELKKLQKTFKESKFKGVAEKALATPIFKSFGDKFNDLKTAAMSVKETLTGGELIKTAGQKIASSISPRYKDRLDYIRNERNLGNRAQEKTLKENYAERSRFLQRNVNNEAMLKKERGSLTEEEFLKGGSKVAKQYEKEKIAIGKGLTKTDTRYSIDDKIAERERRTEIRKENKFKESADVISKVAKKEATDITPMAKINLKESKPIFGAAEEAKSEQAFATKQYQDTQIENDLIQTKLFEDQLDVQREILKVIKEKETTTNGDGVGGIVSSIGELISDMFGGDTTPTVGKGSKGEKVGKKGEKVDKVGKKGGKFSKISKFVKGGAKTLLKGGVGIVGGLALEAGGDALKESGYQTAGDIVSTTGSATEGASTGAMLGSVLGPAGTVIGAGAGAIMGAAQGFSDTFGEGGFELIQKLRKEDAISYGLGTTPTVEKWDVIEKLPKEDIQILINTNEFEGKDLQHLEKLLEPPKESVKASKVTSGTLVNGIPVVKGQPLNQAQVAAIDLSISMGNKPSPEIQEAYDLAKSPQVKPNIIKPKSAKVVTKEGVSINQEGWDDKSSDLVEPIRPVITGNETEAELDAMTKSMGFRIESPKAIIPSVTPPTVGSNVYDISKANSDLKTTKVEAAPIINAPTVNNNTNNTTQNSVVRLQVRDLNTTIQDYFKSRY